MISQSFFPQSQSFLPQITNYKSSIIRAPILNDVSEDFQQTEPMDNSNNPEHNLAEDLEKICRFFLDIVKQYSPEFVLSEFKNLFINPVAFQSEPQKAFYHIIVSRNEEEFKNTLKRTIYILLNNWIYSRKYQAPQDLIELLSHSPTNCYLSAPNLKHLKDWLANFISSQDYQEVKLFVAKHDNRQKDHWKSRYTSYLLAPQYANSNNSIEQRKAAKALSKQLQDQFKFELAMYTAHSDGIALTNQRSQNPTALGDEAIRLIKQIVAKRGFFSYANLANIFLKQTQQLKYRDFKQSLIKYLFFSVTNQGLVENLKTKLDEKLDSLYENFNEQRLNKALLLKTCNRVIEYLTMKKYGEPSSLFVVLASQGNPLTLSVILLKVLLICPTSRTHLEVSLASLIEYYENCSQEECHWVIKFLEVTRIILAIYTENVQYNLVNMDELHPAPQTNSNDNSYRIFSQQSDRTDRKK